MVPFHAVFFRMPSAWARSKLTMSQAFGAICMDAFGNTYGDTYGVIYMDTS